MCDLYWNRTLWNKQVLILSAIIRWNIVTKKKVWYHNLMFNRMAVFSYALSY